MWMILLLALLGADSGPSYAQPPGAPSDMVVSAIRGEDSVRRRCSACHAVGADDQSPNPRSPPLRDIALRYPVENLEEALAEGIYVGHNSPMPPFALEADEVADITAYLKQLNAQRAQTRP